MRTAHRIAALALTIAAAAPAAAATLTVTVLDREGRPVPDAVVVVQPAQRGGTPLALPLTASISQDKMQFVPAVTVVPVGAKVTFSNNDSWDHHVRGSSASPAGQSAGATGGIDLRLDGRRGTAAPKTAEVVLAQAGPIILGCHLHGSMRGHIFVADSPWTVKTGSDGQAQIDGLPDGPAQVRAWHPEQLVDLPAASAVLGATPARLDMGLQIVPRRRRS
jgi:plastocyanin